MIYIGIDPGKNGAAVALWDTGGIHYMRTSDAIADGRYHPRFMAEWIRYFRYDLVAVAVEAQSARPGQGVVSMLSLGYGWGLWSGLAASTTDQVYQISPKEWQKILPKNELIGKARSIALVQDRLPNLQLTRGRERAPHDGLADAACIALWLKTQMEGRNG